LQSVESTREGLSGPLLTVPTSPDVLTVGVEATAGRVTGLPPPLVVKASISATVSPTETTAVIKAVMMRWVLAMG
jgi:hypothetical protein